MKSAIRKWGGMPTLAWAWHTMAILVLAGCQSEPEAAPVVDEVKTTRREPVKPPPVEEKQPTAAESLDVAAGHLATGQLEDAGKALAAVESGKEQLSSADAERLMGLLFQLQEKQDEQANQSREAKIAEAEAAVTNGELEAATALVETVLAAGPSQEQVEEANALKATIEDRRKVQRELRSALRLLSSDKRSDVRAARTQLWDQAEVALPLLLKSLDSDDPVLVENALEILRMFNQPERTVPAMVAVLSRPEQSACWPAAIREITKAQHPGAGESLLALALSAKSAEQKSAALTALSGVVDPPPATLVALLPLVYSDGPELAAALGAIHHSVIVNKQADVAARRGLDAELSEEEQERLNGLSERLAAIVAADAGGGTSSPAAQAAMTLGVVTRQITPLPLSIVAVARVVGEDAAGPAAGVLDGVWNSTDVKTMWRHPIGKPASIVLDLGAERTVTGVRIWNYNEAGIAYRGWKEVEIFVSPTPSLLSPVTEGLVPIAPGAADTPDYSVTLQVPFVRGRYVKLQPRQMWQPDGPSGLSEVQVIGF